MSTSEVITSAASVGTLVVTAVYVWLTYRILNANKQMVASMGEQLRSSMRPTVVVSVGAPPWTEVVTLRIENCGRSVATGLRLSVDKSVLMGDEATPDQSLNATPAFSHPIASFPPGAVLEFFLGSAHAAFNDTPGHPAQFTVSASYSWDGSSYSESTALDLRVLQATRITIHPVAARLEEIRDALKTLAKAGR